MEAVLVVAGLAIGLVLGFVWAGRRQRDGASTGAATTAGPPSEQVATPPPDEPETAEPRHAPPVEAALTVAEESEHELEQLHASTGELTARVQELESQLRRYRRWVNGELFQKSETLSALWRRKRLPGQVHSMGLVPEAAVLVQLRELARPLQESVDELGIGEPEVHFRLGMWHAIEGRGDNAAKAFEAAVRKGMGFDAWLALGDTLWSLGRQRKARELYMQCIGHSRKTPAHAIERCAHVELERRRYNEVLSILAPLIDGKKATVKVYAMASLAAGKQGDNERAVSLCEAGLARHRNSPVLLASMIIPLAHMGERERAEHVYRSACEIDPEFADTPFALGVVHLHEGEHEHALERLQEAIELRPDYPEAFFCLGVIHNRQGEYKKGLEHLERAVELRPDYAEAYYNMKDSYDGLRDFSKSIAMLERAVQLNPEYK